MIHGPSSLRRYITSHIISLTVWYIFYTAIYVAVEWSFYRILPISYWFEYRNITLDGDACIGQDLVFVSHVYYKRSVPISFTDTLRCDFGDGRGFRTYETQIDSTNASITTNGFVDRPWTFSSAHVPNRPGQCYLRSVTTAKLPYGIDKPHKAIEGIEEIFKLHHCQN